ncbi:response regulator transcription factor [Paenibacillus thiaminolyticus]|uniref:Response regulator transcription factor n=1 Tax=Paenibacillus thiaminolyticus TaxID=49283 RepID=A0AAP9J2K1_PANTH|nr:response regulator transcription factor [Paenibacillus thiaminolyticus]MCY9535294.1 response regulator transcription factor [Paenibacillus thiaminolyticus]MCY9602555.1 response regulator transcription factor [Paenibacillus thiaminolyticus]MCY9606207.1 response regulator transcription factor [Paenibacillus thiaminolyticus]MCY9612592.1 response regulator transcription factor [Paenibacillus thiaminolyticus]MCY9620779.1 response regulator transcription factor [Paenibacillus thiaminolyticus]
MHSTVLIADDEPDIVSLLKLYLEAEGLSVLEAGDGAAAMDMLRQEPIDLAIVDIMMPELDGYQLIKSVRKDYKLPIIIISAKNRDADKIIGLGLGADDFITKPFSPLEVVARVQAQLRRTYEFNDHPAVLDSPHTRVGAFVLDHHACALYKHGEPIALSANEYKLMKLLMGSPGRIFTKKQIFEKVWSEPYIADDNTIMVQISRLREKIEDLPRNPVYLKTIRGLGYRFAKEEECREQPK